MRKRFIRERDKAGYSQVNTFAIVGCKSAYQKGEAWLAEAKKYIWDNILFVKTFLQKNLPKVKLVEPEGTYLLWLDFSAYGLAQKDLDEKVTHIAKLWLDSGAMFGMDGKGFERMNVACPRSVLQEALNRLKTAFA
jgi:cystathionine beta-lyase